MLGSIIGAIITIVAACFLVKMQEKREDELLTLEQELEESLDYAATDYQSLTSEEAREISIYFLEKSVKHFNEKLAKAHISLPRKKEGRNHHARNKKTITDD